MFSSIPPVSAHLDPTQQLLAAEGQRDPPLEEHLAVCETCRQQVQELIRLNSAAAAPLPEDSGAWAADPGPIPWADDPDMAPAEEVAAAPVPRGGMVGRYQLLDELGQGGMGVVYAAHDQELDRKVAVKLLKPGRGGDGHARLLREAQAMARISHPNVLPVFDVGTFGRQVFVAMEFVDGGTLRDWLKKKPSWREVLGRFLSAGRGLAAAHQVGLVHRDFKPDNVLVGKDGRVFVTDFGLARLVSDTRPDVSAEPTEVSRTGTGLSAQLTQAGVVMGTPAYMAPEQHLGRMADARSDQFSFAAALYWGLWRKRPFDPQRLAAAAALSDEGSVVTRTSGLRRRPLNEVIQPPPAEPKVPTWLREAVLRALALNPEDRYPSMEALLSELEKRIAVNRRSTWAAAAAVTLLAGTTGVVGYRQLEARAQLCSGGPQLLSDAWDPGVREAMTQAFVGTGVPDAAEQSTRTAGVLDAYRQQWLGMHREACEATRIREEQSDQVLTLRMSCLDRRLQELRSLSGLLRAPDPKLVRQAVDAALQLAPVRGCADISALTGRAPLPEDPSLREQISQVTSVLAEANALRFAGRFADSLARIEPQVEVARSLRYRPLEAEVLYTRGYALDRTGKREAGEAALVSAYFAADSGRDDVLRAQAASRLLFTAGQQSRLADAQRWEAAARAALERLGGNRELEADLLSMVGNLQMTEGKLEEGMASLRQGLELITAELGTESPKRAIHLGNVGGGLVQLGRNAEAIPVLTEAIGIIERLRGKDHSTLAAPLNGLSGALLELRRFDQSHAALDRSLAIVRSRYGPKHPWVGGSLDRKATIYQAEGKLQEALETYRAALASKRLSLPPTDPDLSYSLDGIGQCLLTLGRPGEALPVLEEALSLRGNDPLGLADTRFALARTLSALRKDPRRVLQLTAQAREDYLRAARPTQSEAVERWLATATR